MNEARKCPAVKLEIIRDNISSLIVMDIERGGSGFERSFIFETAKSIAGIITPIAIIAVFTNPGARNCEGQNAKGVSNMLAMNMYQAIVCNLEPDCMTGIVSGGMCKEDYLLISAIKRLAIIPEPIL
jgi:hypothetical protein